MPLIRLICHCFLLLIIFPIARGEEGAATLVVPPEPADARLAWYHRTLIKAYLDAGRRNPKWDQQAIDALNTAAHQWGDFVHPADMYAVLKACETAISAGCDDSLVRYVRLRIIDQMSRRQKTAVDEYEQIAWDMEGTQYPALRRCNAFLRAEHAAWYAQDKHSDELKKHCADLLDKALALFPDVVSDSDLSDDKLYEVSCNILDQYKPLDGDRQTSFDRISAALQSKPALLLLVKGQFLIDYAWDARGGGWASEVTAEGWEKFHTRLTESRSALEESLRLDAQNAIADARMITVSAALGDRKGMDRWFDRAVAVNPNELRAYEAKRWFIAPRWGGRPSEAAEFGRECVKRVREHSDWRVEIAFNLLDAHINLWDDWKRAHPGDPQFDYWKKPDVVQDVKDMYDAIFSRVESKYWRAGYAWYAWKGERWEELDKQITALGADGEQLFFGGAGEYAKCKAQCAENLKTPRP